MIIIIDIDETLALNKKRYELATDSNGKINWDLLYYFDNVISDSPNLPMIDLVKDYKNKGYEIIIFTSRPDWIRNSTEHWLNIHNIPYDFLHMRSQQDHTIKDTVLKKKMYESFINDKVFCAYDDKQEIIDLWVSLGIPSFKVTGI